jgi:myo-inositol-1(or 4)-monophosphatase
MENELFKKVAISAVKEAGKFLDKHFQQHKDLSFKGRRDMMTDMDTKSEKVILDTIKSQFHDHAVLSEEAGLVGTENATYLWVVDPLDGTMNYYYGMNPYRVGICLLENKKPILNVLYNPTKDELYVAQKGRGAFLNDKKITVSDVSDLKNAVVMFHLSSKKDHRVKTINILEKVFEASMQMRLFGSTLASMSYIATGKFDAYFNISQKPWDILCGALLVQEAGGKVTDIHGGEITYESTSLVATNGKVHEQLLKVLDGI